MWRDAAAGRFFHALFRKEVDVFDVSVKKDSSPQGARWYL